MTDFVLATRNPGKVVEIRGITGIPFLGLDGFPHAPLVDEDQGTIEGNALKKAREVAMALGLPAVSDDTGLFVDALDGQPGADAAIYAGVGCSYADNNAKLLAQLAGKSLRRAVFRCCAACVAPDGRQWLAFGELDGEILSEPRGKGGFGYDPVFYVPSSGKTLAELTPAEKNTLSHRGQAFRRLAEILRREAL